MENLFTEILTKRIRYAVLISIMITTFIFILLVLFLPTEMAIKLKLNDFLNDYTGFILTIFFVALFLLITQAVPDVYKYVVRLRNKREGKKKIEEARKSLYEDDYAWRILLDLYYAKGNHRLLVRNNQKVLLLEKFGMIQRTSVHTVISAFDMHNAEYPYVLQPETEKYISEVLEKEER